MANQRGEYGDAPDGDRKESLGAGGILLVAGIAVGVYALSPGARHFYKHGRLPSARYQRGAGV
jgi:hypothetical protein